MRAVIGINARTTKVDEKSVQNINVGATQEP